MTSRSPNSNGSGVDVEEEEKGVSAMDMDEMVKEARHFADVCKSLVMYAPHSLQAIAALRDRFSCMPASLRVLVPTFHEHLSACRAAVEANQAFLRLVYGVRGAFQTAADHINYAHFEKVAGPTSQHNMAKVLGTLKQFARDWSAEGKAERAESYGVLVAEMLRLYPDEAARRGVRVLVPGSGLGRLPFDLAAAGFDAQGNEFSYHMLLGSYLVLNHSSGVDCFTIHPFVDQTTNVNERRDQTRAVRFPDCPLTGLRGNISMAAGDFLEIYGAGRAPAMGSFFSRHGASEGDDDDGGGGDGVYRAEQQFDAVVTCFFLDTANSVLEYVRAISHILRDGGHWINLGPLLYHFHDMQGEMSVELPFEDIKATFAAFGLRLLREDHDLPTHYNLNARSLMRTQYRSVFFTCQREPRITKKNKTE